MTMDLRKEQVRLAKKLVDDLAQKFVLMVAMGLVEEKTFKEHILFDLANMHNLLDNIGTEIKDINDNGL